MQLEEIFNILSHNNKCSVIVGIENKLKLFHKK